MRVEWTTGTNLELKEQAEGGAVDQTPQRKVRLSSVGHLYDIFVSYIQKTVMSLHGYFSLHGMFDFKQCY